MTVIPFPTKSFVAITSRMITETRRVTGNGTTRVRYDPPLRVFWLELVEPEIDGCSVVWDGCSYLDALAAASDWAADEVEVRDRVAETWGRA